MNEELERVYGQRVRVRVCGLCVSGHSILMVNHGMYDHPFWAPPGGGIEFGESAIDAMVREFREETGMQVKVIDYLFACEFIKSPLHAVELFFAVRQTGGSLISGADPETSHPTIREVRWIDDRELTRMKPEELHGIFRIAGNSRDLVALRGYHKI